MQKNSSFLNILRAIRAGRCRERRYADHIFIQVHFRMHRFVVTFSKFSSPQAARGHWPLTKILRTPLSTTARYCLLLQMHVAWSVCASVCWSQPWALQERLKKLTCRLGICRDQPNSRFHGRDIFREIGLLPWKKRLFPWNPRFFEF